MWFTFPLWGTPLIAAIAWVVHRGIDPASPHAGEWGRAAALIGFIACVGAVVAFFCRRGAEDERETRMMHVSAYAGTIVGVIAYIALCALRPDAIAPLTAMLAAAWVAQALTIARTVLRDRLAT